MKSARQFLTLIFQQNLRLAQDVKTRRIRRRIRVGELIVSWVAQNFRGRSDDRPSRPWCGNVIRCQNREAQPADAREREYQFTTTQRALESERGGRKSNSFQDGIRTR